MDGSHPKNIDPRPKRRRDEENPYEIYTTGINTTHPRYFLAFTDSNKVKRWMEIDKTLLRCPHHPVLHVRRVQGGGRCGGQQVG